MKYREYIGSNKKEETRRIHAQSLQDLCHTNKETSFLLTNGISKISKEDSTSSFVKILQYKLLKYMRKSCSDTFISCYTRNGNIKAKLKTSEKWITITSPDDLFKHRIDVDYKQIGWGKILNI